MSNIKITDLTVTNADVGDIWVTDDSGGNTLMFNGTTWEDAKTEVESRMDRLERMIETIADRLAVLDEPDPEKLEQFKTLKDAYTKYKFVEGLGGQKKEE